MKDSMMSAVAGKYTFLPATEAEQGRGRRLIRDQSIADFGWVANSLFARPVLATPSRTHLRLRSDEGADGAHFYPILLKGAVTTGHVQ
jgi:hypothetical protein